MRCEALKGSEIMGMFQTHNYGRDFTESMIGMGNFLVGKDKDASDLEQKRIDNVRADKTLAAQVESSRSTVAHNDAQTEKIKRESEQSALLQQATTVYGKIANGGLPDEEDIKVLGKMRVAVPYLSNNLGDNKKLQNAHTTIIAAQEKAKSLPASDSAFKFEQGDHPDTDKVLDAVNTVLSPARHKTHVDTDGAITGTPGAEYSTNRIQAFAGRSGNGTAETAAYFSIVDANGNPIYQKDAQGNNLTRLGADGKPVPVLKLVPSTIGQDNNKDGRVNFVPAEAGIMKSKLALEQLQAESKLTPEQQAKLKSEMEISMYGLMPDGTAKLLATQVKDNKPVSLTEGSRLVEPRSGRVIADNPRTATKEDRYKAEEGVKGRNGWVQDVYYDGDNKEIKRGGPRLQFNPRGESAGGNRNFLQTKRDIATRLREAQRGHQNAIKSGDPDTIIDSVDLIEALNADAKENGVTPMPVPNRPFSSSEDEAIKAQALKNLEEQRGSTSKFFGIKPNIIAVNVEARRLKQTLKPGKVSFADPQQPAPVTNGSPPAQQSAVPRPVRAAAMTTMPPPNQHAGRIVKDTASGKRYQSNGSAWLEVR